MPSREEENTSGTFIGKSQLLCLKGKIVVVVSSVKILKCDSPVLNFYH